MIRILKYAFVAVAALALLASPSSAQDKPKIETTTIALEVKGMT
jgi:hypothetical protein